MQLLKKQGWKEGTGLGVAEQVKTHLRLLVVSSSGICICQCLCHSSLPSRNVKDFSVVSKGYDLKFYFERLAKLCVLSSTSEFRSQFGIFTYNPPAEDMMKL